MWRKQCTTTLSLVVILFATRHKKVAARFYWKGMKQEVDNYCKACTVCFKVNPKMSSDAPPLHPVSVLSKVWSLVGIDLVGPLPTTKLGNKYIVATTDHFSKWTEAAGILDKSAKSVANFLFGVVCRLGCMDYLISDQGVCESSG